ncbi:MAG: sugar ABC transporter substrate-binding protein, partial [Anaerolineae bacterium]|nr:sugar ABC transporter substrate-binding protein [Anaerolineae bacterium]
ILIDPALITRDFLLENNVTSMDELVAAMPILGESAAAWYPWMETVLANNDFEMPMIGGGASAEADMSAASPVPADLTTFAEVELPEAFAGEEAPRIIVVRQLADGAFMSRYLAGVQSMAEQLGVEWVEFNARGDAAQMVTLLESAIAEQPDGILISHGTTDVISDLIDQAVEQGIAVATFDTVVDNPAVPEIEQDDLRIGFELMKHVALETNGSADMIYLNIAGFPPLDKRDRSYQNFVWRYPGLVEQVKAGAVTESTAADTQTRMEALLSEFPETDVVVAMWDELAKGAVRAIEQAGLSEFVKVYAVDITDENIDLMIQEGSPWEAVVATDPFNAGRVGLRTVAAMVGGEDVGKYILIDPALITRDFLLENNVTSMDELVAAMPILGESAAAWYPWMFRLLLENQ